MKTKKVVSLALLCAVASVIFVVELYIPNPFPIPGIKLGLANIVTVYGVYKYRGREIALVLFGRILIGAMFTGQAVSLIYSLAGGVCCLGGMLFLCRVLTVRYVWLCSVFGALFHNVGQILAAVAITGTPAVFAYLPVLIVSGCLAGLFTGLAAQFVLNHRFIKKGRDR